MAHTLENPLPPLLQVASDELTAPSPSEVAAPAVDTEPVPCGSPVAVKSFHIVPEPPCGGDGDPIPTEVVDGEAMIASVDGRIVGIGRYDRLDTTDEAAVRVAIDHGCHVDEVRNALLAALATHARRNGIHRLTWDHPDLAPEPL